MEQIAVSFTDWWVPKTWLTPLATIIDLNGNVMVENWVCKEVGYWRYTYNFNRYNPDKVYLYVFDWWSTLSSSYDRYRFGGNELDAYTNKYSWGRTAAPYFTSVNGRFDSIDKAIKNAVKSRKEYDDKEIKKKLTEIKKEIKWKSWYDVYKKLDNLDKILSDVKQSVVDTSATNDWNSSKNFSGINGKLDLMAEYVVNIKEDIDNQLSTIDDNVAQRILESNMNLNEWMSNKVTLEQLLQQVDRLEEKLNEVVDSVVSKRLPQELTDKFDLNISRKGGLSDEDIMSALWGGWLEQWLGEGMDMGMNEGLWEARDMWNNAPVDMQGMAEPVMPNGI